MTDRPLTDAMRTALFELHQGWPFGIDARTLNALEARGLIVMVEHPVFSDGMARLTIEGEGLAKRIWLEAPIEWKRAWRAHWAQFWGVEDQACG